MSDINATSLERALSRVEEISGAPKDSIVSKVCDVSNESQVKDLIDFADDTWKEGIDVAFFNAGIMHSDDDNALTTEEAVWDLTHKISK